jgi:hypothetical protein
MLGISLFRREVADLARVAAHPFLFTEATRRGDRLDVYTLATRIRLQAWAEPGRTKSPSILPLQEQCKIKLEIATLLLGLKRTDLTAKSSLAITICGDGSYTAESLRGATADITNTNITGFKVVTKGPASDQPTDFFFDEPLVVAAHYRPL